MHLLLTDRLACPRCGPEFGLILLADRVEERRVLEGVLGCPNCRDRFPVHGGFGDLRAPPRTALEVEDDAGRRDESERGPEWTRDAAEPVGASDEGPEEPPEEVIRLAALLGVAEGPGHLALVGDVARFAVELAELLDGPEVVAVSSLLADRPERPGVSRIVARPGLPFYSRSFRGVALSGKAAETFLDEAVRVAAPTARVVVVDAAEGTRGRLLEKGLEIVLEEAKVVVGAREPRGGRRTGEGVALPVFPGPPPENP